jgi:phage gp36-like protein
LTQLHLSIYRLYSRRIYTEIPETISAAYKNAIKTLEDLKKGIITLQTEEETNVRSSGEYRTNKTESDRIFNKRVMNFEY